MGLGIAQVFAQAGFDVHVHDRDAAVLAQAIPAIDRRLARAVERGSIDAPARDAARARLAAAPSLDRLAGADAIVEAIVESRDAKREVFAALDRLARPETLLASNTSSIPIAVLGAATARPDRVLGLHFMNPVPAIPLVELVRGRETSDRAMALARQLVAALGKTAVESADVPGFIANRMLMPMINEAVFALADGVATAEAIDAVMTLGMRHPMGPLALADLIGLDVCVAILDVMHEGLGDAKYRACPLLRRMVAAGTLGRKTGRGFFAYPPPPDAR
jgi:3-hydroxybutyryl-CoA dehydrogenase